MERAEAQGAIAPGRKPDEGFWIYHPYLLLAFRLILAAVFIYAAAQKIGKPAAVVPDRNPVRVTESPTIVATQPTTKIAGVRRPARVNEVTPGASADV